MNCSRCGAEVQREWKACPQCGLSLAPTTPIQAILQYDVAEIDLVREARKQVGQCAADHGVGCRVTETCERGVAETDHALLVEKLHRFL